MKDYQQLEAYDRELRNLQRFKLAVRRSYRAKRVQLRDQTARARAALVIDETDELELVDKRIAELLAKLEGT